MDHCKEFGIRCLRRHLSVSPAGFYKWKSKTASDQDVGNAEVLPAMRELFEQHNGNYGSPRLHRELIKQGCC
jgi:hypothetical protein